jgi:hypothetical protein
LVLERGMNLDRIGHAGTELGACARDLSSRDDLDIDAALACLRNVMDDLRAEVAAEITRKRAPELVFRIARPDELQ